MVGCRLPRRCVASQPPKRCKRCGRCNKPLRHKGFCVPYLHQQVHRSAKGMVIQQVRLQQLLTVPGVWWWLILPITSFINPLHFLLEQLSEGISAVRQQRKLIN